MNPAEVAQSSTLIAEITGTSTPRSRCRVMRTSRMASSKSNLTATRPKRMIRWVLIQAGAELDADLEEIDNLVDAAGYDLMAHESPSFFGDVIGPFAETDFTMAGLTPGLSWEVTIDDGSELVLLSVTGSATVLGDYNENGELDAGDLDLQAIAISEGNNPPAYDLTGDGLVDFADRQMWVDDLKNTWIGDANLDLEFNSGDMVQVFVAGKYETGEVATWNEGDWNGRPEFGSGDMVAAFAAGGYEQGQRPVAATAAVPEPSTLTALALGLLGLWPCRRRRR